VPAFAAGCDGPGEQAPKGVTQTNIVVLVGDLDAAFGGQKRP